MAIFCIYMAKSRKKANVVVVVLSPGPIPQVLVPVVVVRVQEELKYEKTKKKINSNLGFLLILFLKKISPPLWTYPCSAPRPCPGHAPSK